VTPPAKRLRLIVNVGIVALFAGVYFKFQNRV